MDIDKVLLEMSGQIGEISGDVKHVLRRLESGDNRMERFENRIDALPCNHTVCENNPQSISRWKKGTLYSGLATIIGGLAYAIGWIIENYMKKGN